MVWPLVEKLLKQETRFPKGPRVFIKRGEETGTPALFLRIPYQATVCAKMWHHLILNPPVEKSERAAPETALYSFLMKIIPIETVSVTLR